MTIVIASPGSLQTWRLPKEVSAFLVATGRPGHPLTPYPDAVRSSDIGLINRIETLTTLSLKASHNRVSDVLADGLSRDPACWFHRFLGRRRMVGMAVMVPSGIHELIVGIAVAFGLTICCVSVIGGISSIVW